MTHVAQQTSPGASRTEQRSAVHEPEQRSQRERIKVLLVTVGLEPGGTERQILKLAVRLNRQRYDVAVCCLKGEGAIAGELRTHGIRVIVLGGVHAWDLRVLAGFYRTVRRERPVILHAFLFWSNLAAKIVGRLAGVPVLITSYRGTHAWNRAVYKLFDRLTVAWAHAVTCCSEAVRQEVIGVTGVPAERVTTIHNGVEVERYATTDAWSKQAFGLREDLPVIGVVCRLVEPTKGVSVLLKAVAMRERDPRNRRCQVLVVGDGPAQRTLRELAAGLGIGPIVHFAGMRHDVPRILPLLDVLVQPSLNEGFGVALIEAMAAGKPVVATAVGGMPEIVAHNDTGLLVPPGDLVALADAIGQVLDDPERSRWYGMRGKERVRQWFSIEKTVRQHEDLYETLLAVHASNVKKPQEPARVVSRTTDA
jgi:glycosyltransferase involved in cell wall biosynthesis